MDCNIHYWFVFIMVVISVVYCPVPYPRYIKGQRICSYNCRRPFNNSNCDEKTNPKMERWTYSLWKKSCQPVKGCFGNSNTFDIRQDCLEQCSSCSILLKRFQLDDICLKELDEFNKCEGETYKTFFVYNPARGNCYPVQGCKGPGYYKTYEECNTTCPKLKY